VIMLGRTIVINPRITNVTFSQDPYARYAYMKLK
jgi:peptide/nickel transport system substrate-binding protein